MKNLKVVNLTCERNQKRLFTDLSFELNAGELLLVEGSNGSGKTSLLRTLCGIGFPSSGEILWQGQSIQHCRELFVKDLIYIGHLDGVKAELTAYENLRLACASHGLTTNKKILSDTLTKVNLNELQHQITYQLSAGQQRRIALARLLLANAMLWILDEPFTTLDTEGVAMIECLLSKHLSNGGMAVVTTHQPLQLPTHSIQRLRLTA